MTVYDDSSGNGRGLSPVGGALDIVRSAQTKYGLGVGLNGASQGLERLDDNFLNAGSLAFTFSFRIKALPPSSFNSKLILLMPNGGGASIPLFFYLAANGSLNYFHRNSSNQDTTYASSAGIVTPGYHTVTIRRDSAANTLVIKLNGTTIINQTYSIAPSAGSSGGIFIGLSEGADRGTQNGWTNGEIHELRYWNSAKSQTVLDQVADPNDTTYAGVAVGDEFALYLLESGQSRSVDANNETDYQKTVEINPFMTSFSNVAWNTISTNANMVNNGYSRSDGGAQNSERTWNVVLNSGVWSLELIHTTESDAGVYTVSIDGAVVGTIEGYTGVGTENYRKRSAVTGIVIRNPGRHVLNIKMATKHASSSNYFPLISAIQFKQTV